MSLPKKDKPFESWKSVRDNETVCTSVFNMFQALLTNQNFVELPLEDGTNYEKQLKSWISENGISDKSYSFD